MFCLVALALVFVLDQKLLGMGTEDLQEKLTTLHEKLGDLNVSLNELVSTEEPGGEGGLAAQIRAKAGKLKKAEKKPEKKAEKKPEKKAEKKPEKKVERKEGQKAVLEELKKFTMGESKLKKHAEEKPEPKKEYPLTPYEQLMKNIREKSAQGGLKKTETKRGTAPDIHKTFKDLLLMMQDNDVKKNLMSFIATSKDIIEYVQMQKRGRTGSHVNDMDKLGEKLAAWLIEPKASEPKFEDVIQALSAVIDVTRLSDQHHLDLNRHIQKQLEATKSALESDFFKKNILKDFKRVRSASDEKATASTLDLRIKSIVTFLSTQIGVFNEEKVLEHVQVQKVSYETQFSQAKEALVQSIKQVNTSDTIENRNQLSAAQQTYNDAVRRCLAFFANDPERLLALIQDIITWIVVAEAAQLECTSILPGWMKFAKSELQTRKEELAPEYTKLMYTLFDDVIKRMSKAMLDKLNLADDLVKAGSFTKELAGNYVLKTDVDNQLSQAQKKAQEKLAQAIAEKKEPAVA